MDVIGRSLLKNGRFRILPQQGEVFVVYWKPGRAQQPYSLFLNGADQMAGVVGIAQSYLSAIERGLKEPSDTILFRIAKQYGKTIE
jgi:hypothetical protein